MFEAIARQNAEENEKWLNGEIKAGKEWRESQQRINEKKKTLDAEKEKITVERERLAYLKSEKIRIEEEKERMYEELQLKIEAYANDLGEMPVELKQIAESNPSKPICEFFSKIGACRFGNRCNRNHQRPLISRTLLIPSFFKNIRLESGPPNEYGSDLALEFDESELKREFEEFFVDILSELQEYGCVERIFVANNQEAHLRGNVYVEYLTSRGACKAQRNLNGRYYASRIINAEFCNLNWKTAICGMT